MQSYCVLDFETTGLNPLRHDRVVEVGAVIVQADGAVVSRFVSLVNPERDLGPTHLHGIYARDVQAAPLFSGIARELAGLIGSCVAVVGHNVRFDLSFLQAEYRRLGVECPELASICTMRAAGEGRLEVCCSDYGVEVPENAHDALSDAEATARLFLRLLADDPSLVQGALRPRSGVWPPIPAVPQAPVSRSLARDRSSSAESPIQKLLASLDSSAVREADDDAAVAYLNVLELALEDRRISEQEIQDLSDVARAWGLGSSQVGALHLGYLSRLISEARLDGVIELCEKADLDHVAALLGVDGTHLNGLIQGSAPLRREESTGGPVPEPAPAAPGRSRTVCFTGESALSVNGTRLSREYAEDLAKAKGFLVSGSVTK